MVCGAHRQHAVSACRFGAAIEMSVGSTNGAACEAAARAAGRTTFGAALGTTPVAALGAGRTMWAG